MLTPRPYQIEGRDFLAGRRFALLADEMRVGKTPQAILAADKIDAQNIVVVCPAIAVPHWELEWRKWSEHLGRAIMPRLCVTSYDRLRINWDEIRRQSWDLAIVDECHFAKSPEAQRTKLIYGKGGLGWIAARLWVLSGTPAPNHPGELWPMLKAFGVTQLDYESFLRNYCIYNSFTQRATGTKESTIPELRRMLDQVMLRRTRKQVAPEMPEIDFQFLEVEPSKAVDLDAVPRGLSEDALAQWLESAKRYDKDNRVEVANAKVLPLAKNIDFAIQNGLLKQTVALGWHIEPLERLAKLLTAGGIRVGLITGKTPALERERTLGDFKRGCLQVLCGNILAAGTAVDMAAASHGWFLELDWVCANNLQAANRLISMEKNEKVTFDVCTVRGSTDDMVQRVLLRKMEGLRKAGLA